MKNSTGLPEGSQLKQVDSLKEEVIETIARSFAEYPYDPEEDNQFFLFRDPGNVKEYLSLYIHQALKNGQLYTLENKGYVILGDEKTPAHLLQYLQILHVLIRYMGFRNFCHYMSLSLDGQDSLEGRYRRKQKKFLHVEMLAVLPEYQHQGMMRRLLEEVRAWGQVRQANVILETDCYDKAQKYRHLGMKEISRRHITDRLVWYDYAFICSAKN